jgi:hypothetical protein
MLRRLGLLTVLLAFASLMLIAAAQAAAKPQSCGGTQPFACPNGQFCQFPTGACTALYGTPGTCARKPRICPLIFLPVCGCNGKTYGNDCQRQSAGVSLRHTGRCRSS